MCWSLLYYLSYAEGEVEGRHMIRTIIKDIMWDGQDIHYHKHLNYCSRQWSIF